MCHCPLGGAWWQLLGPWLLQGEAPRQLEGQTPWGAEGRSERPADSRMRVCRGWGWGSSWPCWGKWGPPQEGLGGWFRVRMTRWEGHGTLEIRHRELGPFLLEWYLPPPPSHQMLEALPPRLRKTGHREEVCLGASPPPTSRAILCPPGPGGGWAPLPLEPSDKGTTPGPPSCGRPRPKWHSHAPCA